MSKAKIVSVPFSVSPRSFKDAGYQVAQIGEGRNAIAKYVLEQCPDFLDTCPKEVKEELFAGFQLRAHELWGAKGFKIADGGGLIPVDDASLINVSMDVNVAMAYTGQAFGKLKEENPALHGIVKQWREKFSKYASACMADLRTACNRIVYESKPRERSANKAFTDAMTAMFDTMDKRAKVAEGRGDATAQPLKFSLAKEAFWKAYNM